jgi:hypothetical protein
MAESSDYKVLKANLPQGKDRLDRVENVVVVGMPDINYCSDNVECWIEQKSPKEPVRSTTRLFGSNHKVSQDQKNWFKRQVDAGGNAYFLIVTDKRWMLIGGEHADSINDLTVEQLLRIALWHTPKPVRDKTQWQFLREQLRSSWN